MNRILTMSGISKSFPGVMALNAVALDAAQGEVVALVGENGAGKSTLMKILAGIYRPDSGSIEIDGRLVELRSPRDAARHGIGIIHQELELVDTLDVAANIFLGREPTWGGVAKIVDSKQTHSEAGAVLTRLGAAISSRTQVAKLSLAHKQIVEIARAISWKATILLMDEPTSSLTASETDRLLKVVRELRSQGVCVIYISHRLAEVQKIADRVVVLRDGKNAGALDGSEITHDRMIQLMVGRDLKRVDARRGAPNQRLSFNLQEFRTRVYPDRVVSLDVHSGEILGVAGLIGAGRSELARAVFGVDRPLSGKILAGGRALKIGSPRDAIESGIYLVPEDRRALGLIPGMTVRENITLPALRSYSSWRLIRKKAEAAAAGKICVALGIRTPSVETAAANLSGGNQQKVVLAKWLSLKPKLIILDEPTRGIDVGAKAEIYELIRKLAEQGVAIMLISSDMEEILGISDRVAVMREGLITGVLERSQCSEEAIMRLAVA